MGYGKEIGRANDHTKQLRQCWTTPQDLFNELHSIFSFTVDACATDDNALLPRYWTEETDCRNQDWSQEIVFCNPPFGLSGSILPKAGTARKAVFLLPLTCLTTRYFAATPPDALAIPGYRIKFTPPEGLVTHSGHPTLGTVILFYGATEKQITRVRNLNCTLYRG